MGAATAAPRTVSPGTRAAPPHAVVVRGTRLLVIRRPVNGRAYSVLPGGGIEPGETPEQAALRELSEETTLTGTVGRLLGREEHDDRAAWYFLMTDVRGTPQLSGMEAIHAGASNDYRLDWVGVETLKSIGLQPAGIRDRLAWLLAGPQPDPAAR